MLKLQALSCPSRMYNLRCQTCQCLIGGVESILLRQQRSMVHHIRFYRALSARKVST
jgi:hypothetical protein